MAELKSLQAESGFSLVKQTLENFPDGVLTLNHELVIGYVNPAFCQLMGFEAEELIGQEITRYLGDLSILDACQAEVFAQGVCRDQETIFRRKDGQYVHISKNVQLLMDEQGQPTLIVSIRDLTQIHELNRQLSESAKQLEQYNQDLADRVARRTQALNEQMAFLSSYKKAIDVSSMVSKCGLDKSIIEVNEALCQRSGYAREELLGKPCRFLWSEASQAYEQDIAKQMLLGKPWNGIVTLNTKEGGLFYLDVSVVPILDDAGMVHEMVNIGYDVTPLVETTQTLSHRLHFDTLTGLPNRYKLLSDAESAQGVVQIALLNIDSFNEINSFYGHALADLMLRSMADSLVEMVGDLPVAVYKLPVDEFALVVQDGDDKGFERLVQNVLEQVSMQSFAAGTEQISVTLSAGLASSARGEVRQEEVLAAADMALKVAKKQRKPWVVYDPGLNIKQRYESNLGWLKRLRSALAEDRLVAFYQPIVNAKTLQVERYECLVRIVEPDGQVIPPVQFLDLAKKVKLYPQLTRRMIELAFARFADEACSFSINLSIEDIEDAATNDWIVQKVRDCAFAERVIFEIVESEGIQNYDSVNRFITEVKRYGVKIAIDDFGAGYSNFIYIMRLDVDFIKIDGSIIRNIHRNRSSQVITETIIDFARKLNIQTVAEFVSDEAVFEYVKTLPLDSLQGYLFGLPEPELQN
jgi:diguanylate cyclase (GGDEF)-like protein/PAS domain S-box-containing protein